MENRPSPRILSTVFDIDNHRIDRLPGNVLHITRTDNHEVTQREAGEVAAWFWSKVGTRNNDPETN